MTPPFDKEREVPSLQPNPDRQWLSRLGPGLITGASDDDPSAITTYSIAGASFGFSLLWTVVLVFPLLAALQLMCVRLEIASGQGLAGAIRTRYPRPVLWGACALLTFANVFQIGADLAGMGAVMEMMTGTSSLAWTLGLAVLIIPLLCWSSYAHMVRVLKWIALGLFAYVVAAVLARPQWGQVVWATVVPQVRWDGSYLATLVGILGSVVSPYIFFWQTALMVDEDFAKGRNSREERCGVTGRKLRVASADVVLGMFFACLIAYFVILATGATLHAAGERNIETAQQAAEALRPLAGEGAYLLFSAGIIGSGMLGVPALAVSAAFALSEANLWRGPTLNTTPGHAPKFYAVFAAAVLAGLTMDFYGIGAVRLLFLAAVLNGVLAPPLIVLLTMLTSDKQVMGDRVSSLGMRMAGWTAVVVMGGAAGAMIFTWFL